MELNWLVQLVNTALWFVPLKLAELLIVGVLAVELELELLEDPHDTTHAGIMQAMAPIPSVAPRIFQIRFDFFIFKSFFFIF